MELANVLSKLSKKEKPEEMFLAIEIGAETVTTAVWQVKDNKTEIVKLGTTEEWELAKEEKDKLLTAIDASLEKALENVKPEPNKVIFGLQESWVQKDAIVKEHAKTLKTISEKFEFKPIGYVVTNEAIIQLLKQLEGTPPTAILIRVHETEIQLTVVNLGKVIGTQTVSRSEDIGADVEEGLARFKSQEKFPSRMLLYNSNLDLESLKQDLLSYNWLERLPFLHFPRITILDKKVTIKAVTISGGTEAAKALGFNIVEPEIDQEKDKEIESQIDDDKIPEIQIPKKQADKIAVQDAQAAGFKLQEDISQSHIKIEESPTEALSDELKMEKAELLTMQKQEIKKVIQEPVEEKLDLKSKISNAITPLKNILRQIRLNKPKFNSALGSKTRVIAIAIVSFFLLLVAAGVYGYWTIPKAKVLLYVAPKTLEKELTLTIDPEINEINILENTIPGKIVEIEVQGNRENQTTGTLLVGEKAKGEVTVYNKTSSAKTFATGTQLTGPNNLKFSLDTQIQVASASSQESEESVTTVFGKAKAAVTASTIGSDHNFPAETSFTLGTFSQSSFSAKNDQDFSGGTSREVQAISQEDVDELIKALKEQLSEQASTQLESEEGTGTKVLTDGAQIEVISEALSGEVGEEAEVVSAQMKVKIKTIAYQEKDFRQLLIESVAEAIPQDYSLQEEESSKEIRKVVTQENKASITILYKAMLLPDIHVEELKKELAGKYPEVTLSHLESLPNFSRVDIEITPSVLPAKLKTFPRKTSNIEIQVKLSSSQ